MKVQHKIKIKKLLNNYQKNIKENYYLQNILDCLVKSMAMLLNNVVKNIKIQLKEIKVKKY